MAFGSVILVTRFFAELCAVVSLSLFTIVIAKVFDHRFPADEPGITTLPAAALSIAILWNFAAIMTMSRVRIYVHILGDLVTAMLLVILGAIGFAHDNKHYLSNGAWREYDNANWLVMETEAATLMLVSFIIQLFLAFLSWYQYSEEIKEVRKRNSTIFIEDVRVLAGRPAEPAFEQKEVKADIIPDKSVGSWGGSSHVDLDAKY